MVSCVYKIEFNKSALELNREYDRLSDIEKEKVADLRADSYFDYEGDDGYICFLITTPFEISRYLEILSNNNIHHKKINLSNDILYKRYDLESELLDKVDSLNSIKWAFFIEDLYYWINNNLDIDIILDRINEVGIENLTELEKDFLDNYND